jgi:cardiolipin synthase (CMP-forming)
VEGEPAHGDLARGAEPPGGPVGAIEAGALTVPNALSLLRLLGVPLFLWLILGPEADGLAILVLAVSGFTDWLDGVLARRWNQVSRLGVLLDPAADRLYILATIVGLVIRDIVPLWFGVLLVARDVLLALTLPFLRQRGYGPPPVHFLGKAATFNLLYAFPLLLLGDGNGPLATLALAFGWAFATWGIGLYWWAGILYVVQIRQLLAGEITVRKEAEP